ncbi:MAG: SnoaL-like domain-containing protein [Parvularculaceae bacterium]
MFDENLMAIGGRLVEGCRAGKEMEGLDALYAPDAVSVEAAAMPGSDGREATGVDAIKAKHEWWRNAFEEHASSAEGPFFHGGDRFSVIFEADVTNRESGERQKMREVGVYTVRDGKIVREEFYYGAG